MLLHLCVSWQPPQWNSPICQLPRAWPSQARPALLQDAHRQQQRAAQQKQERLEAAAAARGPARQLATVLTSLRGWRIGAPQLSIGGPLPTAELHGCAVMSPHSRMLQPWASCCLSRWLLVLHLLLGPGTPCGNAGSHALACAHVASCAQAQHSLPWLRALLGTTGIMNAAHNLPGLAALATG